MPGVAGAGGDSLGVPGVAPAWLDVLVVAGWLLCFLVRGVTRCGCAAPLVDCWWLSLGAIDWLSLLVWWLAGALLAAGLLGCSLALSIPTGLLGCLIPVACSWFPSILSGVPGVIPRGLVGVWDVCRLAVPGGVRSWLAARWFGACSIGWTAPGVWFLVWCAVRWLAAGGGS